MSMRTFVTSRIARGSLTAMLVAVVLPACASGQQLTGNWAVDNSNGDGAVRRSYFTLTQQGDQIRGSIRTTQFYYLIKEGWGTADKFTIVGSSKNGTHERTATYQGRVVGSDLELSTRRRATDTQFTTIVAHRVPDGEGAMPARIPLPERHVVRDNGLARTPPMGWNSWNRFAGRVDDAAVRGMADAMASNGMKDAGYQYINIDDTWEAGRDAAGNIQSNRKFPDMKALADYVHGKGLKLGIYSSPGPNTCAGYEGSYGHEAQDARTYAAWGIDYLKYDWCGARTLYTDEEMPALYQIMGDALVATGRPIVYSLCQYGRLDVWKWGAEVGGNLWRTTGDIRDAWSSMTTIGFGQNSLAPYAKPGHWNDPDMLEIGNGGMSDDEYRTHMSLWSMLAAPLLAGNDLRTMSPSIHDILTNREVIAIDQDALGRQGARAWASAAGDQEVWTRPLAGGALAVAIFNRGPTPATIAVRWADIGITNPALVRDLWTHSNVDGKGPQLAELVPAHGVAMLRVSRTLPPGLPPSVEELAAFRQKAEDNRLRNDWASLDRYRAANAALPSPSPDEARVVFLGNSITDGWARYFPAMFPGKPYVGRGIGGQTTPQMLVRFQQDVVALHPKVVVILGGTNDIAGNTGPSTLEMIEDNLMSMTEIAKANGIHVVLSSVLPVFDYPWRRGLTPASKIMALNAWMKNYAARSDAVYLDFESAMSDERHGLRADLTRDGVHPTEAGYRVMAPLAEAAIADALRRP